MAPETTETAPQGYVENPDHVPNPTDLYGTLDTSGTAGAAHGRIEEISPLFEKARQDDLATAARALDPDDDGVPASLVVLPEGQKLSVVDPEAEAERLKQVAAKSAENPVDLTSSRVTPPVAEAAESGPEAEAVAEAQQAEQGAGSGATDGGGTPPEKAKTDEAKASGEKADPKTK